MFKKIIREIAVFIFSIGLILYVIIYEFLFNILLFRLFRKIKTRKIVLRYRNKFDKLVENIGGLILEELKKKDLWW